MACDQLLFVDDGSTDGSSELIQSSSFPYLKLEARSGIGKALIEGTKYGFDHGFEIIIHMSGNGKMLPEEVERLTRPILEGTADYVWGSRFLPGGRRDHTPLIRRFGIPLFNFVSLLFTGCRVSDISCGYRAYKLSLLETMATGWDQPWLYGYEFEYFVLVKVLKGGAKTLQVPISMLYPASHKNYTKIIPIISWWSFLKPWIWVSLGIEPKETLFRKANTSKRARSSNIR